MSIRCLNVSLPVSEKLTFYLVFPLEPSVLVEDNEVFKVLNCPEMKKDTAGNKKLDETDEQLLVSCHSQTKAQEIKHRQKTRNK